MFIPATSGAPSDDLMSKHNVQLTLDHCQLPAKSSLLMNIPFGLMTAPTSPANGSGQHFGGAYDAVTGQQPMQPPALQSSDYGDCGWSTSHQFGVKSEYAMPHYSQHSVDTPGSCYTAENTPSTAGAYGAELASASSGLGSCAMPDVFKFEPEYIQRFQSSQSHASQSFAAGSCQLNGSIGMHDVAHMLSLEAEYFNYDEINCQSKTQSPCSSPSLIDPWMCMHMNHSNGGYEQQSSCQPQQPFGATSPKHQNNAPMYQQQQQQHTPLPPIKVFANHHPFSHHQQQQQQLHRLHHQHQQQPQPIIDSTHFYDTALLDSAGSPELTSAAVAVNFNHNDRCTDKPNREHKNIWHTDGGASSSAAALSDCDENTVNIDDVFRPSPKPQSCDSSIDDGSASIDGHRCPTPAAGATDATAAAPGNANDDESLECRWTDCNELFGSQATLVAHIEKRHVEQKKGEEFSCFWHDCVRRTKPFNARYKLLIHMRVHSGEKPNKCPVSRERPRERSDFSATGMFVREHPFFVLGVCVCACDRARVCRWWTGVRS